jgi:hypothetical protein
VRQQSICRPTNPDTCITTMTRFDWPCKGPLELSNADIFLAKKVTSGGPLRLPECDPPGQASREGAGLGAYGRQAGAGVPRRAPLARTRHPPSGGLVSGAVVVSSARGTWGASARRIISVPITQRDGGTRRYRQEKPQEPPQQPRKTTPAS